MCEQLGSLGLSAYEPAFRDKGVCGASLSASNDSSLEEIGVTDAGHRREILRLKAELE